MPSQQEIENLFINRGSDYLIYQRSAGNGPVYLVSTAEGKHTVHLKSGQYGFGSNETGAGEVQIDLRGGGMHDAKVISTTPESLPENATTAIDIVLHLDK